MKETILNREFFEDYAQSVWGCTLEQLLDVTYVMETLDADVEAIADSTWAKRELAKEN